MTNGAEQHTGMNWTWWGGKKVWKYKIGVFLYGSDSFPSTLYESWTEWEEVRGDACGCFMNSAVQKIQFEWTGNIPTPFQIFSISVGLPANNTHKIKLPQPVLIKEWTLELRRMWKCITVNFQIWNLCCSCKHLLHKPLSFDLQAPYPI